ncbi:MAG: ribosome maturation factor RimP [Chitinivibrionia bacterium]|nr:ribosome maturation factor RimP [Chitinivibrionia bacterium]
MKLDEKIICEIEKIVESLNAELYEVKFFLCGKTTTLRIFADTKTGITLDECANISRNVSDYLDLIDFSKGAYTLEVSSPGVTRTLVSVKDFERVIGKEISVRYKNEDNNLRKKSGVLKTANEKKLAFENGEEIEFSSILSGKLVINL